MRIRNLVAVGLAALFVLAGSAQAAKLTYAQRQAVQRQQRNLREHTRAVEKLRSDYAGEMEKNKGLLIPPGFFEHFLGQAEVLEGKLDAMGDDLKKNGCPPDDPQVRAIVDGVAKAKASLAELRAEIEPRLAESRRIADPKSYPNIEKDFEQIESFGKAYSMTDFLAFPERTAELAEGFQQATEWCSEKFKEYRPLMVVTGGKGSPWFQRYARTAQSFKKFNEAAGAFLSRAERDIPRALQDAERMADRAVSTQNPQFFTGGVRQNLEKAEAMLRVAESFLGPDDPKIARMRSQIEKTRAKLAGKEKALEEKIIAAERAPEEVYEGSDKEQLRKEILAEWKKAWPDDEVLAVRFHMKDFRRNVKWTWNDVDSAWEKSDKSVLAVTVIVKTSDKIATTYPAYINIDNLSNRKVIGVQTKGGQYVHRKMLIANL